MCSYIYIHIYMFVHIYISTPMYIDIYIYILYTFSVSLTVDPENYCKTIVKLM